MDKILNLEGEFDIATFDLVVKRALSNDKEEKAKAEKILMEFKNLSNSWTKVDCILKNSTSKQSKFIGLQILEENVKRKWSMFDVNVKNGIREYIFMYIVNNSEGNLNDIVLKKVNEILINIALKDWPKHCPTFIPDIIGVSQSTNMAVCTNILVILKGLNDHINMENNDMTTARTKILKNALEQEYDKIFTFLMNILEYSEKQDLDVQLLKNCLTCFSSYCKSMKAEYIFSTRAIEIISRHLNTSHSIEVLNTLYEIIDLFSVKSTDLQTEHLEIPNNFDKAQIYSKINLIYKELLNFFNMYMGKFDHENELAKTFYQFDESEKMFVKSYARCFCSLFLNYFDNLEDEDLKVGLVHLINISKIPDVEMFREIFTTWHKIIYNFYAEYPFFKATAQPLKRMKFAFVLEKLFPIMIGFMPKPQEVFVIINDLGETVKDKTVQTLDIEFGAKLTEAFQNISFSIKDFVIKYLINESQKQLKSVRSFDLGYFSKMCWVVGCYANVFDQTVEQEFFIHVVDVLLTICEATTDLNRKSIVASCIIYIISKYKRFLKFNIEFMYLVIQKLIEFMETDLEGLDEMSCEAFLTIAQTAPMQFMNKYKNKILFEDALENLPKIQQALRKKYPQQRIIVEGTFEIVKANKLESDVYISTILQSFCDHSLIKFDSQRMSNMDNVKAVCHMFECYCIGFEYMPNVLQRICNKNDVLVFYQSLLQQQQHISTSLVKVTKEAVINLCIKMATTDNSNEFYNAMTEIILLDFKNTHYASIIKLANVMIANAQVDMHVQRVLFIINNIVMPTIPLIQQGDSNPDVTIEFLNLNIELIKTREMYNTNFALIMANDQFSAYYSAILFTLSCIKDISSITLKYLTLLFERSFESSNQQFFTTNFLNTLENLVGLIIDKDTKNNYVLQCDFLYTLIKMSQNIGSISQSGDNQNVIRGFLTNLFENAFDNVTPASLNLFIQGLYEISDKQCFSAHVDDFVVKIYEYGTDEYLEEEKGVLNERIGKK